MGTNFFVEKDTERIHIGKRSMGWKFLFDHNNWEHFKTKEEFVNFLAEDRIVDEYGEGWPYVDFMKMTKSLNDGLDQNKYLELILKENNGAVNDHYLDTLKNVHEIYRFGYRFANFTDFC